MAEEIAHGLSNLSISENDVENRGIIALISIMT